MLFDGERQPARDTFVDYPTRLTSKYIIEMREEHMINYERFFYILL